MQLMQFLLSLKICLALSEQYVKGIIQRHCGLLGQEINKNPETRNMEIDRQIIWRGPQTDSID
jgi:hypothetical protein